MTVMIAGNITETPSHLQKTPSPLQTTLLPQTISATSSPPDILLVPALRTTLTNTSVPTTPDDDCGIRCDNIGGKDYHTALCFDQSVDIVYTWVNGSDPRLIRGMHTSILRSHRLFLKMASSNTDCIITLIVDLEFYTGVSTIKGNVDCAYKIYQSSGWSPWVAFKNGNFKDKLE